MFFVLELHFFVWINGLIHTVCPIGWQLTDLPVTASICPVDAVPRRKQNFLSGTLFFHLHLMYVLT